MLEREKIGSGREESAFSWEDESAPWPIHLGDLEAVWRGSRIRYRVVSPFKLQIGEPGGYQRQAALILCLPTSEGAKTIAYRHDIRTERLQSMKKPERKYVGRGGAGWGGRDREDARRGAWVDEVMVPSLIKPRKKVNPPSPALTQNCP